MRGEPFLYPDAVRALARDYIVRAHAKGQDSVDPLTPRESQVVKLIAEGSTNREIADELSISAKTVGSHRANILEKLGMRDRVELTRYAIRRGLVERRQPPRCPTAMATRIGSALIATAIPNAVSTPYRRSPRGVKITSTDGVRRIAPAPGSTRLVPAVVRPARDIARRTRLCPDLDPRPDPARRTHRADSAAARRVRAPNRWFRRAQAGSGNAAPSPFAA